jgi:hypothetical protein
MYSPLLVSVLLELNSVECICKISLTGSHPQMFLHPTPWYRVIKKQVHEDKEYMFLINQD